MSAEEDQAAIRHVEIETVHCSLSGREFSVTLARVGKVWALNVSALNTYQRMMVFDVLSDGGWVYRLTTGGGLDEHWVFTR